MKKLLIVFGFAVITLKLFAGDNVEARKIFENSKQKLSLRNVHLVLDLQSFDAKGNEKTKSMDVSFAEFGEEKKVMVEVTAPENISGTKILTTDSKDQKGIIEIYMPSTGKIQKIRANQRNLKMLGSEIPINQFSSAVGADSNMNIVGEKSINGTLCHQIKMQKEDEKEYDVAYISVDQERLVRIETFDSRDNLVTQTDLSNYMKVEGIGSKMYPRDIHVKNLKSGKSSLLKVRQVDYLGNLNINDFKLSSAS
ncbi:outer membrane lipoprotein-sorting protein [Mangrovibacterium lignilyticum]|uniref:outer membrane lipoprotein-sorting protein n=1 Tax=Mangrovibacterium lignilyticum TaxID=2668052 RepID=UPI0013D8260A|nr:outer membrane lipoprotein-sorting protein [Mangrovibacterium lignilyticum]